MDALKAIAEDTRSPRVRRTVSLEVLGHAALALAVEVALRRWGEPKRGGKR